MVNYWMVLLATFVQFVLGAVWYSPLLFGGWWMEIMEVTKISPQELQKMQKEMGPFYLLQFLLTFFTTVSFANLLPYFEGIFSAYHVAFWLLIGFVIPVQIGTVIWGKTQKKFWLKQIFVMVTYQTVSMMLLAWIVG